MNNIYKLIKEYRQQKTEKDQKLFMMALEYATRRSLKNLLALQEDSSRFESMYEGWISTTKEEKVLLDLYSFALDVMDQLTQYCVSKSVKKEFDDQQKVLIKLLLKNQRFYEVAQLLQVRMEDESFKELKVRELKELVLGFMNKRGFKNVEEFHHQLFKWIEIRRFPPYMLVGYDERLTFTLYKENIDNNTLAIKIAKVMQRKPRSMMKIVNELIKSRDLQST